MMESMSCARIYDIMDKEIVLHSNTNTVKVCLVQTHSH